MVDIAAYNAAAREILGIGIMPTRLYDGDTFEVDGKTFRFRIEQDDDSTPPWKREDGHGPVSEWTTRAKRPGEWTICGSRSSHRYYDFQEAVKIARRDGWGHKRQAVPRSPKEMAAWAAEEDYERIRAWCQDKWCYVGVIVTLVGSGVEESVWGVESDCLDHQVDLAQELAGQILHLIENQNPCAL